MPAEIEFDVCVAGLFAYTGGTMDSDRRKGAATCLGGDFKACLGSALLHCDPDCLESYGSGVRSLPVLGRNACRAVGTWSVPLLSSDIGAHTRKPGAAQQAANAFGDCGASGRASGKPQRLCGCVLVLRRKLTLVSKHDLDGPHCLSGGCGRSSPHGWLQTQGAKH